MSSNDTQIRVLAVYNMLIHADKALTLKEITDKLNRDYSIDVERKTLYNDICAINLFENVKYVAKVRGYLIKK